MKKLIVIAGVVLITYLILMTTLSQPTSAPSADKAATEQSVSESEYRIGALDGKVAVFVTGICTSRPTPRSLRCRKQTEAVSKRGSILIL